MNYSFSALTLLLGRQEGHLACKKTEWWGADVVICLERGACRLAYGPADATATHCLAPVKSRLVLPFWYRLTWVGPDKGPLSGCMLSHELCGFEHCYFSVYQMATACCLLYRCLNL